MMRRAVTWVALVCGVFAVTAIGCGGPSGSNPTAIAPTTVATASVAASVAASAYVTRVNQLCAELRPKVLEIYGGGHPAPYPINVFEAEQPQLTALYTTFDAEVDEIPVADADRPAVDVFDAYRRLSDEATAKLVAAAATGDQAKFDAAFWEVHEMFDNNSTLKDLQSVGIGCNAR